MQSNTEHGEKINIPTKFRDEVVLPRSTALALPRVAEIAISRLLLILALISGGFLRLWQLNAMGYNTDEAVYAGQAAAIAGVPGLKDLFPIFRAHPLLFQFLLSLVYRVRFGDLLGRVLAVAMGLGTVFLTYQIGKALYGRMPGALSAMLMALMPYHVVVSRQVLLDGPMVFFATLTLYMLVLFGTTKKVEWLFAAGATMGLTFLSKETSIIMIGAIYAFLALSPELRIRFRDLIITTVLMAAVIAPFPVALMLAGGSSTGRNYLAWQLFRRPNHDWLFYLQTVPPAIGVLLIIVAALGFVFLWRERSWREKLLLAWILVPVIFFQIWPVKGYQYLLPIVTPLALLAGRLLGRLVTRDESVRISKPLNTLAVLPIFSWLTVGALVFTLGSASWQRIQPQTSSLFLAGTGGVPGGREVGVWILQNVPENAAFMTIGPSMANIIQFYGERKAYGLSVSPNPLHRNPSYEAIVNPDLQIRNSNLQYLVWDSFSAARSPFFSNQLLSYVKKYNGRAVHTETIPAKDSVGNTISQPVIIIYEVHP
jgi:4-amino-4-deoxy-L-arabinose transferase-like glycosyltransferase